MYLRSLVYNDEKRSYMEISVVNGKIVFHFEQHLFVKKKNFRETHVWSVTLYDNKT